MKKFLLIIAMTTITLGLSACSKTQEPSTIENMDQETTTPNNAAIVPKNVPVGDTAETSLDWVGEYEGTFPCADCEAIKVELELNPDKTYELKEEYVSDTKSTETKTKGSFSFDPKMTSIITLDEKGENRKFFVGENFLEARDIQTGEKINSNLNYRLIKH
ncbi:copper resistance protein NlpE [Acinetobacter schindleri]|uniref:copper resistance protein NlpE n=1 Tax=Acinetobacter schindleri TaxID=108981 RepID=UPI0034D6560C